jgi:hypothetical protein
MSHVLGGVTVFRLSVRIRERVRIKIRVRIRVRVRFSVKFKIQKNTKLRKSKNSSSIPLKCDRYNRFWYKVK